jgi:endonuclease/exonuclease/phosphatase family metal-dependent hydrolase
MKVLTWNTLASEWIDDKTYKMVKKHIRCNTEKRFQTIVTHITNMDPSLVLLQEVMPEQYAVLKQKLHKTYIITPLLQIDWHKTKNNSGNVTLFKRTDFAEKQMQHFPLEFGLYTNCVYKNHPCKIYNIHLSDISANERKKQMNTIMHSLLESKYCIIGGDFNHQYRKNTQFYNIPEYTIHNTKCATYYIESKMNIDNLLSKGFVTNELNTCANYPLNIEKGFIDYGSDHLPVLVDITQRPQ